MINYVFNSTCRDNSFEIAKCINLNYKSTVPIVICIGSDLVVGDSLGPYVGSKLNETLNGKVYVYGTLNSPITAKEVPILKESISLLHPRSKIIVVDAAVGNKDDVGQVKIYDCGINPGLGVNKNLPKIGDLSIIGIVSEYKENSSALSNVRFSLIESLAKDIIGGISLAFGGV